MKPHILLLSVAAVIVCVGVSCFFLAPYAERSLNARLAKINDTDSAFPVAPNQTDTITDSPAIITEDTNEGEVDRDERIETEDGRDTQSTNSVPAPKPTVTPTPKPTPTPSPTPTPTPTPEPAPKPSGYTMADVALHASKSSCWTAINGSVYDITSYIPRHPGGERNVLKICGKDGTSLFEGQHGGDSKPEAKLASFRIAALVQ